MVDYKPEQTRIFQLLHDIKTEENVTSDEADDEEDYLVKCETITDTEQDLTDEEDEEETESPPKKRLSESYFIAKDGKTIWHKHIPNEWLERSDDIVVTDSPGVQGTAKEAKTSEECWSLFFTGEMLDKIVTYTNNYLSTISSNFSRERSAKQTDVVEIKAFFGLLYLAGCYKTSRINMNELWDRQGMGIEMFWVCMPRERFRFLSRYIRFDDTQSREDRRAVDKLAAIREVLDIFQQQCRVNYNISEYATVGNKIQAYRGRCGFIQHTTKTNKYGIQIWALVDAKVFYTQNLEINVGPQPRGPYFGPNDGAGIMKRLIKPISGTGRNITADQFFTSFELIEHLLNEHKLTYIGTVHKRTAELPREFLNIKGRKIGSSLFGFQNDIALISSMLKKGKNVILASSMHSTDTVDASTTDQYNKCILALYNKTKGGVDTVQELCDNYEVARTTRRWSLVVFYALMDIAGINAQIIYNENNSSDKGLPRRKFLKSLALSLVDEHLKRQSLLKNIPYEIRQRRQLVAGTSADVSNKIAKGGTRKKCFQCKNKNKSRFYCYKCYRFICLSHANFVCSNCISK